MISTTFSALYTTIRKELRDPQGGGTEGTSPRWTLDEKKQAINDAISDSFPQIKNTYIDEATIVLINDTFEYSLPTGLKRPQDLLEIYVQSEPGEAWKRQGGGWHVRENNGTLKLYIDKVWDASKKLRLVYAGPPPALSSDADATSVPAPFVLSRAKYYLHMLASESAARSDMDVHVQRAQQWWQISEALLNKYSLSNTDIDGATAFSNWANVS